MSDGHPCSPTVCLTATEQRLAHPTACPKGLFEDRGRAKYRHCATAPERHWNHPVAITLLRGIHSYIAQGGVVECLSLGGPRKNQVTGMFCALADSLSNCFFGPVSVHTGADPEAGSEHSGPSYSVTCRGLSAVGS